VAARPDVRPLRRLGELQSRRVNHRAAILAALNPQLKKGDTALVGNGGYLR
jgi:hypothetical protein